MLIVLDICKTQKLNVSNKSISKTMKNQISPNNFIRYASIFGESIFANCYDEKKYRHIKQISLSTSKRKKMLPKFSVKLEINQRIGDIIECEQTVEESECDVSGGCGPLLYP